MSDASEADLAFDFDLEEDSPAAAPAPTGAVPKKPDVSEAEFDFDFDFELDIEEPKPSPAPITAAPKAPGAPPAPPKKPVAADGELDFDAFDLSFDVEPSQPLPETPRKTAPGLSPAAVVQRDAEFEANIFSLSSGGEAQLPLTISPLLMDVSPRTLGVVAAGGYCHELIERNAPIPTEETSEFTTSQDGQTTVRVPIYQGEGRTIKENQELGVVELLELRPAPRGQITISVTFIVDADGTLSVKAKDLNTGKEQSIRINLNAKLSDREVERLRARQSEIK